MLLLFEGSVGLVVFGNVYVNSVVKLFVFVYLDLIMRYNLVEKLKGFEFEEDNIKVSGKGKVWSLNKDER